MEDGPVPSPGGSTGRRDFISLVVLSAVGLVAAAGTVVAAVFAAGTSLRSEARARGCAPVGSSGDGPSLRTIEIRSTSAWAERVERRGAYVETLPDGTVRAFSATCPHAGCFVDWRSASNDYFCPCHASRWNRDGELLAGPAKRGLDPLPVTPLPGGGAEVCYTAFVLDTADRVEVG
jgi:Rieske Fe-S protein